VALLIWGFYAGGGVANVFSTSAQLQQGQAPFWSLFWPSLAANVGYWITLSLNIPDFTRYAKSQRSQVVGQAIGLPLTMTAFSFIGIAVTAATVVVFGEAVWDPVALITRIAGELPAVLILAMVIIVLAQISTNMAANVVSPLARRRVGADPSARRDARRARAPDRWALRAARRDSQRGPQAEGR
jgi:NCS1 family nucleobase:cation symporter-1